MKEWDCRLCSVFGECRQHCAFEAENKESLKKTNSMRKGPGSPCTGISVDFYGRSPEFGRCKAFFSFKFWSTAVQSHSIIRFYSKEFFLIASCLGCLLILLSLPGLVTTLPRVMSSLHTHTPPAPLCEHLYVQISPYEDTSYCTGPTESTVAIFEVRLHLQRHYFQLRSH